jgi:GGDEF domain-containing protein
VSITDITERKRAEAPLRHGALHDTLAGLPNRALFLDRLPQALERARPSWRLNCGVGSTTRSCVFTISR